MSAPDAKLWLHQAYSDAICAQYLHVLNDPSLFCHIVAKYQQAVEKLVKSVATAVQWKGITVRDIGYSHNVSQLIPAILGVPQSRLSQDVKTRATMLFTRYHTAEIIALCDLAPRRPAPGALHQRNTEYPFETERGVWTCPAERGVFTANEIARFKALWDYLYRHSVGLIDALFLTPRGG